MKVSLTQAWEATGFAGVVLRTKIGDRLAIRFNKENPEYAQQLGRAYLAAFGALFVLGVVYGVTYLVAPYLSTDFTYSMSIASFVFFVAIVSLGVLFTTELLLYSAEKFSRAGSPGRYIYQHRDEEIEL